MHGGIAAAVALQGSHEILVAQYADQLASLQDRKVTLRGRGKQQRQNLTERHIGLDRGPVLRQQMADVELLEAGAGPDGLFLTGGPIV